jgi:hypothetical protein
MSVLLTTAQSLCLHEPSAHFREIEELRAFYKTDYPNYIGASDSGLAFFLPWILDNLHPHTVIIERDPDEVTESLYAIGLPRTNIAYLIQEALEPFRGNPLCLWVPFRRLDDRRTIEKVFWHLLPGVPFDEERYEQLRHMNIQASLGKTLQSIADNAAGNRNFLRDVMPRVHMMES